MSGWIPVRASRLHRRQLVCADTAIRQASLFPFFNGLGVVKHVLIVDADSSELRMFQLDTARAFIPFWGPIRVEGMVHWLNEDIIDQLAPLWHYDPWWLLRDERFAPDPCVPILTMTNCAESFRHRPSELFFSGRLTKVGNVLYRNAKREDQNKPFRRDMLPVRKPAPPVETPRRGWQLDPFWQ